MPAMTQQEELEHLRAVRLRLLSGESVEEAQHSDSGNARRARYTPANLQAVEIRIRSLESALGLNRRRPIGFCL